MAVLLSNNATSRLAGSIDAEQTNIPIAPGTGLVFPKPANGDWFPVTIEFVTDAGTFTREIVHCTAVNEDMLTVLRGREGTQPAEFVANTRIEIRLTAGAFGAFNEMFNQFVTESSQKVNQAVTQADAALAEALTQADADLQESRNQVSAFIEAGHFARYDLNSLVVTDTLDLAVAQVFRVDATQLVELKIINVPEPGRAQVVIIHLIGSGGMLIWPDDVPITWDNGKRPNPTKSFMRVMLIWDGVACTGYWGAER